MMVYYEHNTCTYQSQKDRVFLQLICSFRFILIRDNSIVMKRTLDCPSVINQ